ncbi:MAE_28990/MAE_18760 family HEPN-like nuclease [Sphingomonadaceae bacterium OTU29MARTA1]|nr:MAE_28990/MAE_18760 family HEPN-like nuclease [Sphingomonadaceae bacterium OTU29MARTA1]
MIEVLDYFDERQAEFERHLFVARLLEARVDDEVGEDVAQVEVRHVNTVKSGLIIHLYNIVEAVTTRTLKVVGETIVTEQPKRWTQVVRKEWVRAAIWDGEDRIGDSAVNRLAVISGTLASGGYPDAFKIKGEPGSWNDDGIRKVADRLGCSIVLDDAIKQAALEPVYRNNMTAMKYLSSRRNAIAHGATTFEEGAHDHTLDEIAHLAGRILPYLRAVTVSYETFLATKGYLEQQGAA